jgi:hypothetical protein
MPPVEKVGIIFLIVGPVYCRHGLIEEIKILKRVVTHNYWSITNTYDSIRSPVSFWKWTWQMVA